MLRNRLISAVAAIAILVPVLVWGGTTGVAVLVALFSGIGVWELSRNLPGIKDAPRKELALTLDVALVAAFYLFPLNATPAVVVFFPLVVLLIHLFLYNVIDNTIDSSSQMIFVLAYVTIPLSHAISLQRISMGTAWVFFVLVVICLEDAGAYFAGKYYGKHHFSSRVSPGKTLEGLAGGIIGSLLGMLIMKVVAPSLPSLGVLCQVTLLLVVLGPLGDLCASVIKRRLSIKDFGSIMPGHGGILDRADSLIPAFPATYYFLVLFGHAVPV